MRVFLDTNILVSAALFPHGGPAQAYEKATLESGLQEPSIMTAAEFMAL